MRKPAFGPLLALVAILLAADAILSSVAWSGEADKPDKVTQKEAETPQALLATFRAAYAAKDWRKCFLCYDDQMRAIYFCSMLTGVAEGGNKTIKEIVLKPLAGKLDEEKQPKPSHSPEPKGARDFGIYQYYKKRVDLPGIVAAAYQHEETNESFPDFSTAWDIHIDGDKAIASWQPKPIRIAGTDGQPEHTYTPRVQQIDFCRIDGQWYLTVPPVPAPLTERERAAKLLEEIDSLKVELHFPQRSVYEKETGNPVEANYCQSIKLSIALPNTSHEVRVRVAQLTEKQARRLTDRWASDGFLRHAAELDKQEIPARDPKEPCITLQVSCKNLSLYEDLGGDQQAIKRVQGLRGVLDGEPAQAVDALLAGFAEEQRQWDAAAPDRAAARARKKEPAPDR